MRDAELLVFFEQAYNSEIGVEVSIPNKARQFQKQLWKARQNFREKHGDRYDELGVVLSPDNAENAVWIYWKEKRNATPQES